METCRTYRVVDVREPETLAVLVPDLKDAVRVNTLYGHPALNGARNGKSRLVAFGQ